MSITTNFEFKIDINMLNTAIDTAIHNSLDKSIKLINDVARNECPVDTGSLRDSLVSSIDSKTSASIKSESEYSLYVHEGTSRQPSQPFLREAFIKNLDNIKNITLECFNSEFKR
jgi:HK97 gp10 family phage protein